MEQEKEKPGKGVRSSSDLILLDPFKDGQELSNLYPILKKALIGTIFPSIYTTNINTTCENGGKGETTKTRKRRRRRRNQGKNAKGEHSNSKQQQPQQRRQEQQHTNKLCTKNDRHNNNKDETTRSTTKESDDSYYYSDYHLLTPLECQELIPILQEQGHAEADLLREDEMAQHYAFLKYGGLNSFINHNH